MSYYCYASNAFPLHMQHASTETAETRDYYVLVNFWVYYYF